MVMEEDPTQADTVVASPSKPMKAMKKAMKKKGKGKGVKRVLAEGEEPPPKKPKGEAKPSLRAKVLMALEQLNVEDAINEAKARLKAASAAVTAAEEKRMKAAAECDNEMGVAEHVQKEVEAAVGKSAEAREAAKKGRVAAIEAAKDIALKQKEAQERHKEIQIIEDELKSGNKATMLKQAKEELLKANERMKEAKEREKDLQKSVKEREKEALRKATDRTAEKEQSALVRQKEKEMQAELRKAALLEKQAEKAAFMVSKTSPRKTQDID